jgi:hypothetical protein
VGADFFHADGQTDRQTDVTKLIAAFLSFASALKTPLYDENANLFSATGFFLRCVQERRLRLEFATCKILCYVEYAVYDQGSCFCGFCK